jgi:hypothetical protein
MIPYSLIGVCNTRILEESATSVFSTDISEVRIWVGYIGMGGGIGLQRAGGLANQKWARKEEIEPCLSQQE